MLSGLTTTSAREPARVGRRADFGVPRLLGCLAVADVALDEPGNALILVLWAQPVSAGLPNRYGSETRCSQYPQN